MMMITELVFVSLAMWFVGQIEGSRYEKDADREIEQGYRRPGILWNLKRMFEEGDYKHHQNNFA